MTATEELRAMLDERGVKWMPIAWNPKRETFYHTSNGVGFCADEYADGVKIYTDATVTPEQAIAATLGAGTCKPREVRSRFSKTQEYVTYHCECGHELGGYMTAELPFPHTYNEDELPNYCPNCGRRVAEVDE